MGGVEDATQSPDRVQESSLFLANADGSGIHPLLSATGKTFGAPSVSPSGKWLAFQAGTTSFVNIPRLMLMPLSGNVSDTVVLPFDRNKSNLTWSTDEQSLYFSAQSNGGQPLYKMDIKTARATQLTEFNSGITGFDLAGGVLAYIKTEVADPYEVYRADANAKQEQRISSFFMLLFYRLKVRIEFI